ncbi:MAG TPA: hypothetical protein VLA32_03015 [Anaerolineales bacterium]|nr:hypothetical protein [Anaerolineales bacterium]
MNDASRSFRQLYRYHFDINQKIWDEAISQLSDEQFTLALPYSVGSVRNQLGFETFPQDYALYLLGHI